jgi:hypothetical protein
VGRLLRDRAGLELGAIESAGALEYGFTHRRLRLRLFRAEAAGGRVRLDGWDRHRWVTTRAFARLPLGTVSRKALVLALGDQAAVLAGD